MANPMEGYTNMMNIGSLKGFMPDNFNNAGLTDIEKTATLDDFIESSENPGLLKGAITKIQQGVSLEDADLSGLSNKESELVRDLKSIGGAAGPQEVSDKFSELLGNYLDNVTQKAKAAEKAVETFASGGNIDLHSVMIASEKASLSMQLTMQLRNKLVQAYQELSHIRV